MCNAKFRRRKGHVGSLCPQPGSAQGSKRRFYEEGDRGRDAAASRRLKRRGQLADGVEDEEHARTSASPETAQPALVLSRRRLPPGIAQPRVPGGHRHTIALLIAAPSVARSRWRRWGRLATSTRSTQRIRLERGNHDRGLGAASASSGSGAGGGRRPEASGASSGGAPSEPGRTLSCCDRGSRRRTEQHDEPHKHGQVGRYAP